MSLVFINYPLETFTPTSSGALATIIYECCRRAERQGVVPYVITRAGKEATFPWQNILPIDYEELPTNPLAFRYYRAERKLVGWRHLQYRKYALQVMGAIKKAGLERMPLVLLNDPEMAVLLRRRFPNAFILHWFFNHMDCRRQFRARFAAAANVQAGVSNFTARYVADYYGITDRPVHTIYIAADIEQFHPALEPPVGPPVINFVGRTGIEKAPDLLLRAAQQVAQKTKAFRLQVIGSNHWGRLEMDDYQRELCELADALERDGISVRRPGHIDRYRLPDEFRKAHIHVLTSRWDEPFALTTLEGMASGLATVASNTGGTQEAVKGHGFLFERDSVEGLAEHLYTLITDEALRVEYGRKGRERAEEFTWERTWTELKRHAGI
jgi:glycosyltransferase involved in cell wall biosynthesis